MPDLCSVCGGASRDGKLRRGMCKKHYERWRVHGDPTIVLLTMPADRGVPGRDSSRSQYLRQWRAANKDKTLDNKLRWESANPETARRSAWATEQRRRGLPPTEDTSSYAGVLLADPCSYCGGPGGQVDHITAQSQGGGGDWDNLTAACNRCNSQKHTKSLLHFMLDRVG